MLIGILRAFFLSLFLVGCGGDSGENNKTDNEEEGGAEGETSQQASLVLSKSYTFPSKFYNATTKLNGNKVIVAGGVFGDNRSTVDDSDSRSAVNIIDLETMTNNEVQLSSAREKPYLTTLSENQYLVSAGSQYESTAEVLNIETQSATSFETRFINLEGYEDILYINGSSPVLLSNGKVGIFSSGTGYVTDEIVIFDPEDNSFSLSAAKLSVGRNFSIKANLPNGNVLIIGGYNGAASANSALPLYPEAGWTVDIYDPQADIITLANDYIEPVKSWDESASRLIDDNTMCITADSGLIELRYSIAEDELEEGCGGKDGIIEVDGKKYSFNSVDDESVTKINLLSLIDNDGERTIGLSDFIGVNDKNELVFYSEKRYLQLQDQAYDFDCLCYLAQYSPVIYTYSLD
jgi:hypothetical protein